MVNYHFGVDIGRHRLISGAGRRGSRALMALMARVAQECNEVTVSDEVEAGHGWTWLDMAGVTQVTSSSSDTHRHASWKTEKEENRD